MTTRMALLHSCYRSRPQPVRTEGSEGALHESDNQLCCSSRRFTYGSNLSFVYSASQTGRNGSLWAARP